MKKGIFFAAVLCLAVILMGCDPALAPVVSGTYFEIERLNTFRHNPALCYEAESIVINDKEKTITLVGVSAIADEHGFILAYLPEKQDVVLKVDDIANYSIEKKYLKAN